jgi:predicted metal-dependent phosphoesterase TrpH
MKKWLLSDFHIHSTCSDGDMEISELIDFYGERNFDVIAITDHLLDPVSIKIPRWILPSNWIKNKKEFDDYLKLVQEASKKAWKKYNMLVIPGIELTNYVFNQHVVVLDIKEFLLPYIKISKTIEELRKQDILTFAAHPHEKWNKLGNGTWSANGKLEKHIDVWEIGNGIDFFPHILDKNLKYIANTDFHGSVKDNGIIGWKSLVYADKTISSVKKAILDQKVGIHFWVE